MCRLNTTTYVVWSKFAVLVLNVLDGLVALLFFEVAKDHN